MPRLSLGQNLDLRPCPSSHAFSISVAGAWLAQLPWSRPHAQCGAWSSRRGPHQSPCPQLPISICRWQCRSSTSLELHPTSRHWLWLRCANPESLPSPLGPVIICDHDHHDEDINWIKIDSDSKWFDDYLMPSASLAYDCYILLWFFWNANGETWWNHWDPQKTSYLVKPC